MGRGGGRGGKGGRGSKRNKFSDTLKSQSISKSKSKRNDEDAVWEDDDDEIDAFHKQRDVIPLDVTKDDDDDDEDMDHPVFDFKSDASDESEDDDEANQDDEPLRGFAAKIARQAKYLKQKFGGGEDEMDQDEDQDDEEDINKKSWGGRKNSYYNADTADYEIQSSDEELPKEEEAEVLRIQREKAKSLSMADLGLQDSDEDESDSNKQSQDDKSKGKRRRDTLDASYEEIKKDIGALSKEEQMDVVFSSAPELIGLLSELNETVDQLNQDKAEDGKVNAVVDIGKAGLMQSEVREALLLMYCQAISFYLLLKSEGLAVRDHPVIGRLVEIKNMLKKLKEVEERFPSPTQQTADPSKEADSCQMGGIKLTQLQEKTLKMTSTRDEILELEDTLNKQKPVKEAPEQNAKQKDQDIKIGSQSLEMLKIRANLEAKLREKGLYSSGAKAKLKNLLSTKPTDRSLVSRDDFDDEVQNDQSRSNSKLSHTFLNKKIKLASGDEDLPKRDDIGERRRKHELRVLGRIGANSDNDNDNGNDDDHDEGYDEEHGAMLNGDASIDDVSEDEFYKEAKRKHTMKLITKQQLNAAKQIVPSLGEAEQEADGKRLISYQMNKNRGLTRHRNKDLKNPRKKYRVKHKKWEERRKGQVRNIKRPSGSYGGEASGINPSVSHSVRF